MHVLSTFSKKDCSLNERCFLKSRACEIFVKKTAFFHCMFRAYWTRNRLVRKGYSTIQLLLQKTELFAGTHATYIEGFFFG